ncbi:zinc finger, CCHC-type containing protein [Tanacetum coccineum]
MLTCRRTSQVQSHHQNSKEAGVSKDMSGPELLAPSKRSGDEGLSSGGTKLISIFITAEAILSSPSGPRKFTSTDFKHTLKHKKDELTLVELGSHLRIEESLKALDSDKPKGNNVVSPSTPSPQADYHQIFDSPNWCWLWSSLDMSELPQPSFSHLVDDRLDFKLAVIRLPDPKLETLGEKGIECIFVGYAEHSKAFRFSSVPRPSLRIPNGIEDIGSLVVPKEVIEEVLADLPLGCKPFSCKWIFRRKLKEDGTIKKFKARLVIQGFRQKSGIEYFDIYAPVTRISTIRLLIAMTSIHNPIIHHMDVKTSFLNDELEEEVYMNKPQSFIMPGNKNKVCKQIKSLYGLKQAPKQCHQKFDEVLLFNGYLLNQADKCVYSKFDESDKGVISCLYVDDMLIFGTYQVQVDLTKEFLSSKFSMKDIGKADVILVSTPIDTSEKLMPNNGQVVSQLEYSRVIGCLIYAMTCTRPDITFAVVLEGYTDASWINNTEYNSSASGWVFLLGEGALSWASKKQTFITGSIMEYEFVALAAADKEAELLKNLLLENSLWSKPITPISIHCDSVATLTKAYSQMYNGKYRHLCVRHSMIRELITNGVISIELVRSQQNFN